MSSIIILQFRQQRLPDSSQIIHNQLLTIHLSHLSRSSFNEIAIINRIKLLRKSSIRIIILCNDSQCNPKSLKNIKL